MTQLEIAIRGILALEQLWLEGKGESVEAEAIRDEDNWQLLTESERDCVRMVSIMIGRKQDD